MGCFVSLSWWVLHRSATLAFSLFHITHRTHTYTHPMCVHKHSHIQTAPRKLHHFPAVVWKLHLSPTIPPITPQVSFFISSSLFSLCLTILVFSLHFNSALNCQAWIALWTAWGGQAGRRCVWMRESPCYHHLFSFSSPSGAVRSQTRYHSLPAPNRESQHNIEEME